MSAIQSDPPPEDHPPPSQPASPPSQPASPPSQPASPQPPPVAPPPPPVAPPPPPVARPSHVVSPGWLPVDRVTFAAVLILAAGLGTVGMLRHEIWRDEAFTWLIIRTSRSARELVRNLGFVGHPRLYYLLNYALTEVFPSFWAIRIANLACALAAIALATAYAPFNRLQKLLFAIGFFPLYQYGVIARSYALFLLLLFAYCALYVRAPGRMWARAFLLAVLAQVHLYATFAAAVLLAWEVAQALVEGRKGAQPPRQTEAPRAAAPAAEAAPAAAAAVAALPAIALVGVSLVAAAIQLIPPQQPISFLRAGGPSAALYGIVDGFVPRFDGLPPLRVQWIAGAAFAVASFWVLARQRWALALYATLTLGLGAMLWIVYPGYRWHHGFFFLFFVTASWASRAEPLRGLRSALLTALFAVQAGMGIAALGLDFVKPYSNGAAVAEAISSPDLAPLPLVGMSQDPGDPGCVFHWQIDEIQPVLAAVPPERGVLNPRTGKFERVWTRYGDSGYFADGFSGQGLLLRLEAVSRALKSDYLLIISGHHSRCVLGAPLEQLGAFTTTTDFGEGYALYRFRSR